MSALSSITSRFDAASLAALRKPLLLGGAGLALLLALWLAYSGWVASRGAEVHEQTSAVRDRLHGELSGRLADARTRFGSLMEDRFLRADLAAGAYDEAATRLRAAWPALTAAAAYSGGLDEAFAVPPASFGYARLALLTRATTESQPVLGIVGHGAGAVLGVAAAVRDGEAGENGVPIAVAYGEMALDVLTAPVREAAVTGGYIELRVGQTVLAQRGRQELRATAVARPLPEAELQLAAAAPAAAEAGPIVAFGGAGLLVLLAAALVVLSRREHASSTDDDPGEMTLAEAIAKQQEKAPARPLTPMPRSKPAAAPPATVERSIFRAYDIRGVLGKTLDEGVARLIGQAIGSLMHDKGLREIAVGRDGRLSGPALSAALIDGLRKAGCDVIDIGLAPTPLVYYATYQLQTGCGVAVTGSHNPPDYNGFKIVVGGETLSGDAITDLYVRIAENRLHVGDRGGVQQMDLSGDYISRVASDIQLERRMRVVLDCGNGVAGALAPQVLEAIGAEAEGLYCEVDGHFPNHHPDPSDPANLADLITAVQRTGAELGLAFDGDGDRLGVVTRSGEVIYPDRLLMLFAQDVLSRNPGATVIYDVKCTGHLASHVLRHGGSPIMWKTGHSLIKGKMRETEAELAGEMSGHFFFRERWYGFDDAIYAAARLLEILAADDREPEEIFAELPKGVSTPELKVAMAEGAHQAFIERFRAEAKFEGAKVATIDGVRADWPDGWGLVRCSNTTPSLVLRFDADSQQTLERIQGLFRQQLLAIDASLKLPF
jgi:phosphomannomutase / phosphoglucomutase